MAKFNMLLRYNCDKITHLSLSKTSIYIYLYIFLIYINKNLTKLKLLKIPFTKLTWIKLKVIKTLLNEWLEIMLI